MIQRLNQIKKVAKALSKTMTEFNACMAILMFHEMARFELRKCIKGFNDKDHLAGGISRLGVSPSPLVSSSRVGHEIMSSAVVTLSARLWVVAIGFKGI